MADYDFDLDPDTDWNHNPILDFDHDRDSDHNSDCDTECDSGLFADRVHDCDHVFESDIDFCHDWDFDREQEGVIPHIGMKRVRFIGVCHQKLNVISTLIESVSAIYRMTATTIVPTTSMSLPTVFYKSTLTPTAVRRMPTLTMSGIAARTLILIPSVVDESIG